MTRLPTGFDFAVVACKHDHYACVNITNPRGRLVPQADQLTILPRDVFSPLVIITDDGQTRIEPIYGPDIDDMLGDTRKMWAELAEGDAVVVMYDQLHPYRIGWVPRTHYAAEMARRCEAVIAKEIMPVA